MTVPIWLQNTNEVEFFRRRTVVQNKSPFTGHVYQNKYLDIQWLARITYAEMTRREAAPLMAAIAAQRDGVGTFYLFDPDFAVPQSGFAGTGLIGAAPSIGGTILPCSGFTPSTLLALPGDKAWINYGGGLFRMVEMTSAATSNGSGDVSLIIDDMPNVLPAINMAVGFNWLGGQGIPMRLTGFSKRSLPGGRFSISVDAEERV